MDKKKGRVSIIVLSTISISFILLTTIEVLDNTLNSYLLRNIVVLFSIIYILILRFLLSTLKGEYGIMHKSFIYSQIYNIFSILFGFIFYDNFRLGLKHFSFSNLSDIINLLFFPGSYFIPYFDCLKHGFSCIGQDMIISFIFNFIIFTILGLIIGSIIRLNQKLMKLENN